MKSTNLPLQLIQAAAIMDGAGVRVAPGVVLLEKDRILAAGSPQVVGRPSDAEIVDCRDSVVIPGLVNVHAHLDLTHIGPNPYEGSFIEFIDVIRAQRACDEHGIAASVRRGVDLSLAGGTVLIGDIAGVRSLTPVHVLRAGSLAGVSFVEVFGLGRRQDDAVSFMNRLPSLCPVQEYGVKLGLQPHAPYSCGPQVYRAATRLGLPLATHLAETLDELQFVQSAEGPQADWLRRMRLWDETITKMGGHPINALGDALSAAPFIAAHLNYIEPDHLALLADWNLTVAYCPRASAYFGHPQADRPVHQYREMMNAGVNVALGTDSIVCLDTPDRISVLDEMRFLYRRDGINPQVLLQMATINGARALGFDTDLVTLTTGTVGGLLGIAIDVRVGTDPVHQLLNGNAPSRWILSPSPQRVAQGDQITPYRRNTRNPNL